MSKRVTVKTIKELIRSHAVKRVTVSPFGMDPGSDPWVCIIETEDGVFFPETTRGSTRTHTNLDAAFSFLRSLGIFKFDVYSQDPNDQVITDEEFETVRR